jgi:uncharacterized protein (DUF488 family)
MNGKPFTIYTIGHGLTPAAELIAAIGDRELVDVRSRPGSRHNPSCNKRNLENLLGERYAHFPQLGGFGWTDQGEVIDALEEIRAHVLDGGNIVLMCAESDPAACHRKFYAEWIAAGCEPVEFELWGTKITIPVTVEHLRVGGGEKVKVEKPARRPRQGNLF